MHKEKLQELITERFLNDKIDYDKFIKFVEKIEIMNEDKAKTLLNEAGEGAAVAAATIGYAALIAGLVALGERYFKYYFTNY